MDIFIIVVGGVLLIIVIVSVISDARTNRKILLKLKDHEERIKKLEDTAVRRGTGGKFQRRISDVPVVPPVDA